eukprot:3169242-Amphidinium_carterae.1
MSNRADPPLMKTGLIDPIQVFPEVFLKQIWDVDSVLPPICTWERICAPSEFESFSRQTQVLLVVTPVTIHPFRISGGMRISTPWRASALSS